MENVKVTVKTIFLTSDGTKDTRRRKIERSYNGLLTDIRKSYELSSEVELCLHYIDEDEDVVNICNDEDFEEALGAVKILKIHIAVKHSTPASAPSTPLMVPDQVRKAQASSAHPPKPPLKAVKPPLSSGRQYQGTWPSSLNPMEATSATVKKSSARLNPLANTFQSPTFKHMPHGSPNTPPNYPTEPHHLELRHPAHPPSPPLSADHHIEESLSATFGMSLDGSPPQNLGGPPPWQIQHIGNVHPERLVGKMQDLRLSPPHVPKPGGQFGQRHNQSMNAHSNGQYRFYPQGRNMPDPRMPQHQNPRMQSYQHKHNRNEFAPNFSQSGMHGTSQVAVNKHLLDWQKPGWHPGYKTIQPSKNNGRRGRGRHHREGRRNSQAATNEKPQNLQKSILTNPTYKAEIVSHITLKERSVQQPDKILEKVWCMRNTGTASWKNVQLICIKDQPTAMNLEEAYRIPKCKAGTEVHVKAYIKVPRQPGRHCAYYRLCAESGKKFGPRIWADILVGSEEEQERNRKREAVAHGYLQDLDKESSSPAVSVASSAGNQKTADVRDFIAALAADNQREFGTPVLKPRTASGNSSELAAVLKEPPTTIPKTEPVPLSDASSTGGSAGDAPSGIQITVNSKGDTSQMMRSF